MRDARSWWKGDDRFEVRDLLGRGGMGEVYLCLDRRLQRPVAVKILKYLGDAEIQTEARFRREAEAMARVQHPNLLPVLDIIESSRGLYLVLEFVEGETLGDRIDRGSGLSRQDVRGWGIQLVDALQALHEKGILHRDLKPANVMIHRRGDAILMDLGLSRIQDRTALTEVGNVLGTPLYLPPELILGKDWSPAGDQYQLGATLFEALRGKSLIPGNSLDEILDAIGGGQRRSLKDAPQPVPGWLRRIVDRTLARNPSHRYPDLMTLRADLEAGDPGVPASQEAGSTLADLPTLELPTPAAPRSRKGTKKSRRRRRQVPSGSPLWKGVALGAGLVFLVGVGLRLGTWGISTGFRTSDESGSTSEAGAPKVLSSAWESLIEPFLMDLSEQYRDSRNLGRSFSLDDARRRWLPERSRVPELLTGDLPEIERVRLWKAWQNAQRSAQQERLLGDRVDELEGIERAAGWRGEGNSPFSNQLALEVLEGQGGRPEDWPTGGARLKVEGMLPLPNQGHLRSGTAVLYRWPGNLAPRAKVVALTVEMLRIGRESQLRLRWKSPAWPRIPVDLWPTRALPRRGNATLCKENLTVILPRSLLPREASDLRVVLEPMHLPTIQVAEFTQLLVSWPED